MKTAEHFIKVYVENHPRVLENDELASLGPHVVGMLVDFRGEIPQGSGYKPETVSGKAERMRTIHRDYVRALDLMTLLSPRERRACIEWAYWCDRRPPDYKGRLITRQSVAEYIGEPYESWSKAVQRGHDRINAYLGFLVG